MLKLIRSQDVCIGIIFIGFGALYLLLGQNLDIGTMRRMGPGFFPMVLSWTLMAIGVVILGAGLRSQELVPVGRLSLKGVIVVSASMVAFAVLLKTAGLIFAIVALVLIASLGSAKSRLLSALALGAGLAVFSVFVFVDGLGLPMPVLGNWFVR